MEPVNPVTRPLGHFLISIIIYEERENFGLEVWC